MRKHTKKRMFEMKETEREWQSRMRKREKETERMEE